MSTTLKNPLHWPLHLKIPVIVATLMIAVSVSISEVVLSRLADSQEKNVQRLTASYLQGLSTAVMPYLARQDVWETYDALDRAGQHYESLKARYTIVALPDGRVLAASDPSAFPVDSAVPAHLLDHFEDGSSFVSDDSQGLAWVKQPVITDGIGLGNVMAEIDLSDQLAEREDVFLTLVLVNSLLTVLFAAAGYLVARHMLRPVSVLSSHIERVSLGSVPEPISEDVVHRQGPEFAALFDQFNTMVEAINQRGELAQRLADEEKLALLGKLASGLAHEVNNHLGGMMNAVDTLRKHGGDAEIRKTSLGLLERGLQGIRNVVRATLVTYKGGSDPTHLSRRDIEDLRYLVNHHAARRDLTINWRNGLKREVPVDGSSVRQAALNLLLNACNASPAGATVAFEVQAKDNHLAISISDAGPGLPPEILDLLSHATRDMAPPSGSRGLGAWTAARLVAEVGGTIDVRTSEAGTAIKLIVPIEDEEVLDAVA